MEFYRETTEGFLNKYVRDQMFCYEPTDVESFGARAVNVVQIERRWIRIGDSDTKRLDGLVPVTRPIKEGSDYGQASCQPRVPANRGEWERADSDSEEEEAGQMGQEGRRTAKRRRARPWEGPGGSAAIATAASTTSKPRGRGSGRDDGTRLWSHNGAIAALEFSQPSLGRRRTGAWRPGSRGPSWAAGGRGGEAAPGPLGHQDSYTELEDRPGAASTGWGTAAVPTGATAGRPTLPEGRQGGAQHWEPSLPEGKSGQRGGGGAPCRGCWAHGQIQWERARPR